MSSQRPGMGSLARSASVFHLAGCGYHDRGFCDLPVADCLWRQPETSHVEELCGICMGYMVILDIATVGCGCVVEAEDGRDITVSRNSVGCACRALFVLARCTKRTWQCNKLTLPSNSTRMSSIHCTHKLHDNSWCEGLCRLVKE